MSHRGTKKGAKAQSEEHLLVDGYNVMHAWDSLAELLQTDFDAARARLIDEIAWIHESEGLRTTIVFDANFPKMEIESPTDSPTFACVYTASGVTADAIIEQLVAHARQPTSCTVVSRDNMVVESTRASGAIAMPPEELQDWVDRAHARERRHLENNRKENRKVLKKNSPWDQLDKL